MSSYKVFNLLAYCKENSLNKEEKDGICPITIGGIFPIAVDSLQHYHLVKVVSARFLQL